MNGSLNQAIDMHTLDLSYAATHMSQLLKLFNCSRKSSTLHMVMFDSWNVRVCDVKRHFISFLIAFILWQKVAVYYIF